MKSHISEKDAKRREKYFKTTKGELTLRQMIKEILKLAELKI